MNCREAEELIPVYVLGALDEGERAGVEAHFRVCPNCLALFHEQAPTAVLLSSAVGSLESPPWLKQRVMSRLHAQVPSAENRDWVSMASGLSSWGIRRYLAPAAMALASVAILGLSLGSLLLWLEMRELRRDNNGITAALEAQMEMTEKESRNLQNLMDLAYTAAIPGISTVMLEGSEAAPQSRGMFMISPQATWAMLWAVNLQQLPEDKAYQVWLNSNGLRRSGGMFRADETGFGQLRVSNMGSISQFQTMGVSIEPSEGSPSPTGASVLTGVVTASASP